MYDEAQLLAQHLSSAGYDLEIVGSSNQKRIELLVDQSAKSNKPEGYELTIESDVIRAVAADSAGVFYAVQTLLQLMPSDIYAPSQGKTIAVEIPCASIVDEPRFVWRGLHLDVCRHFMPFEFLKKYIDLLAMHKMNTFHLHLTDDQGWRIEIKKFPKLTQIGAWRDGTLIGHKNNPPLKYDNVRYGGFYTQEQLRELVDYAAK